MHMTEKEISTQNFRDPFHTPAELTAEAVSARIKADPFYREPVLSEKQPTYEVDPFAKDLPEPGKPEQAGSKYSRFLIKRLDQIRSGYNNLSDKQKDILSLGAMALSTTIFPAIGVMEGGSHVQASEHFLQWEGLGGFAALIGAASLKFRKLGYKSKK